MLDPGKTNDVKGTKCSQGAPLLLGHKKKKTEESGGAFFDLKFIRP